MVKAFSPEEVKAAKIDALPDFVIETWNKLLALHYPANGGDFIIKQEDAITALLPHTRDGGSREEIFAMKWLDIEDVYRKQGWKVEYDKPAYYENYDAFFRFRP